MTQKAQPVLELVAGMGWPGVLTSVWFHLWWRQCTMTQAMKIKEKLCKGRCGGTCLLVSKSEIFGLDELCPCPSVMMSSHHSLKGLSWLLFAIIGRSWSLETWRRRRLWWKGATPSKAKSSHSNEWWGQSLSHRVNFWLDFSAQCSMPSMVNRLVQKWTIPGTDLKLLFGISQGEVDTFFVRNFSL